MTDGSQLVGVGKVRLGKVRVVEGDFAPAENPFKLFESEGFGTLSDVIGQKLGDFIDEYGERWVCEAMKEAAYYQKRNLPYVRSILDRYRSSGIDEPWKTDGRNKGPKQKASHHDLPTEAEVRAAEKRRQEEMERLDISQWM
jgi:DnaD/phage-associated family protein